jgi:hypothetical protein
MPQLLNLNSAGSTSDLAFSAGTDPTFRRTRLIGWVFLGLLLSLMPLGITALMEYEPGRNSLLEILSNEDLLTVAFTLSGATAVDTLINTERNIWKFLLGVVTMLMTLVTIAGYVPFKGHLTHLSHGSIVDTTQVIYCVMLLLSFLCEANSGS